MSGEVTAGADRGAVNETTVNFKGRESSVHFNPTAQSPRIAGPVFDQYFPAAWTWVRASFIKGVRVTLCRCVGNLRRWETLNRPPHEFLNLQTRRRDIGRTHRNVKPGGRGRGAGHASLPPTNVETSACPGFERTRSTDSSSSCRLRKWRGGWGGAPRTSWCRFEAAAARLPRQGRC